MTYGGNNSSGVYETWSGTKGAQKTNGTEGAVYSCKLTKMDKLLTLFNANCHRVGCHGIICELHYVSQQSRDITIGQKVSFLKIIISNGTKLERLVRFLRDHQEEETWFLCSDIDKGRLKELWCPYDKTEGETVRRAKSGNLEDSEQLSNSCELLICCIFLQERYAFTPH